MNDSNAKRLENWMGAVRPWELVDKRPPTVLQLPAEGRRRAKVVVYNMSVDPIYVVDESHVLCGIDYGAHETFRFARGITRRERLLLCS